MNGAAIGKGTLLLVFVHDDLQPEVGNREVR